ncbi:uncharacterized protein SPSK_04678 [Sporothrix schenckii 1099-18]|uniref:Uncharacterized protein n=1 Tax=Sporothrix schenckii 1099-18 TaxID=1397361 RepID=A0A0F2M5K3_SPOSC|nr:uncharacterized protein SPSK_04678 [Sporothrix schenckii 1099-18]KJR83451.1 hypothetical protein SPSK_04678 [Sporothrix schenckii 1099-18]
MASAEQRQWNCHGPLIGHGPRESRTPPTQLAAGNWAIRRGGPLLSAPSRPLLSSFFVQSLVCPTFQHNYDCPQRVVYWHHFLRARSFSEYAKCSDVLPPATKPTLPSSSPVHTFALLAE